MQIVYATDGSRAARSGESLLTSLFLPSSSKVHVVDVTPLIHYDWLEPDPGWELQGLDVHAGRSTVASETAARLTEAGFEVSSSSRAGDPANEILKSAEQQNADLIVLGASHTTWLGNHLFGSVGTYVLHHAPCSVLVAHRPVEHRSKVLIAIDGSEHAATALRLATEVLDPQRCSVEVVTVVPHTATEWLLPMGPYAAYVPDRQRAERALVERGWTLTHRAATELRVAGFDVAEAVLVGAPAAQLLKEAENCEADLVVVGSRGLRATQRLLMGSVSDQISRHAPATLVSREHKGSG